MAGGLFNTLPTELYLEIANYLTLRDLLAISHTSAHLHAIFVSILYQHGIRHLRNQTDWEQRDQELRENELALNPTAELQEHEVEPSNHDSDEDEEDIDLEDFTTDSEHDPDADQDDEGWENVDEEAGDEEMEQDMLSEGEQEMLQWHNNMHPSGIFITNPFENAAVAEPSTSPIPISPTPSRVEAELEVLYAKFLSTLVPAEHNIVLSIGRAAKPSEMDRFLTGLPKWKDMGTQDSDRVCWILTEACVHLNYPLAKHLGKIMGKELLNHRVFTPARTWVMENWETYAQCDELGIRSVQNYRHAVEESDGEELDVGGKYSMERKWMYEQTFKKKTKKKEKEEIDTVDIGGNSSKVGNEKVTDSTYAKVTEIIPETYQGPMYQDNPQRGIWNSILKSLLKSGLSFNVTPYPSPIRHASANPSIPIIHAAVHRQLHLLRLLLAHSADPNSYERIRLKNDEVHPVSPLSILMDCHFYHNRSSMKDLRSSYCHRQTIKVMELLVSKGAEINAPGTRAPLFALVEWSFGSTDCTTAEKFVLACIRLGADVNLNFRPGHDISVLEWLLHEINFELWPPERVVKLIRAVCEAGANIDHRDNLQNTPLLIAVANLLDIHAGRPSVVEVRTRQEEEARWDQMMAVIPVLLEYGADPWKVGEVLGVVNEMPAHSVKVAACMGNEEIMEMLLPGLENYHTRRKWLEDEEFRDNEGVEDIEKVDLDDIWGEVYEFTELGTEADLTTTEQDGSAPTTTVQGEGLEFLVPLVGAEVGDAVEVEIVGVDVDLDEGGDGDEDEEET